MATLLVSMLAAVLACVPVLLIWDAPTALVAAFALTLALWPLLALAKGVVWAVLDGLGRVMHRES